MESKFKIQIQLENRINNFCASWKFELFFLLKKLEVRTWNQQTIKKEKTNIYSIQRCAFKNKNKKLHKKFNKKLKKH